MLPSGPREEEEDSPTSSATEGSLRGFDDMFLRHKVEKMDTLAGLAVRYNVSVSDIKRSNGLLSDSAMFARDTLLIPRQSLPVGPEYSTWVGMIVTQYGRLGHEADTMSTSAPAYGTLPGRTTSIQQLRGYYSTGPSRSHTPQYESDGEDRLHLVASVRPGGHREVELMARQGAGGGASPHAASSYAEERLRRRRAGESVDGDQQLPVGQAEAAGSGGGSTGVSQRPALFASPQAPSSSSKGSARGRPGSQWRPGHWKDTVLDRMKRAASQPVLLDAARSLLPASAPGSESQRTPSFGTFEHLSGAGQQLLQRASVGAQRLVKQTRKAD